MERGGGVEGASGGGGEEDGEGGERNGSIAGVGYGGESSLVEARA